MLANLQQIPCPAGFASAPHLVGPSPCRPLVLSAPHLVGSSPPHSSHLVGPSPRRPLTLSAPHLVGPSRALTFPSPSPHLPLTFPSPSPHIPVPAGVRCVYASLGRSPEQLGELVSVLRKGGAQANTAIVASASGSTLGQDLATIHAACSIGGVQMRGFGGLVDARAGTGNHPCGVLHRRCANEGIWGVSRRSGRNWQPSMRRAAPEVWK
eukprot:365741-Chlamydomonas_euryale.AAC.2